MEATVESISRLIQTWTGAATEITQNNEILFYLIKGDYAACVLIDPLSIESELGDIPAVNICITFCFNDKQPVNVKPHIEGTRCELFQAIDQMTVWGKTDYYDVDEDVTILILQRYEVASELEVSSDLDDPDNSKLLSIVRYLTAEWCNMNELLTLLIDQSGSDDEIASHLKLLLRPTEGHC